MEPRMGDISLGFAFQDSTTNPGFLKSAPLSARPDARWVLAGVPWDMLSDGVHPLYGVTPLGLIADAGDLTLPNTSLAGMRAALAPQVDRLIAQHHMIWLGGDHSITLPLLQCYRRHFGRPLAVVHFDAHCDTWPDHYGEPSGHGTWVHEAVRDGLVDPSLFVQLGIRSAATPEISNYIQAHGGLIYTARDLRGRENSQALAAITSAVRQRLAGRPDVPLYLTLDIDCLDPAFAPGTGTPEPGGLTSNQVLTLLEDWRDLPFIGMDLCEVAPPYDHAELSSYAAANFVWTYLCGRVVAP
jgi:agmatinase